VSRTIGVDLGGTKIQTVVLDGSAVTGSDRLLTPQSGAEDVISAIVKSIRTSLAADSLQASDVVAIGIGSPGRIDLATGVVDNSPNVPGFATAVPLAARVSTALTGVPTFVDNDIRVAVRGERRLGGLASFHDAVGVFLGTGVGGGLIIDDRLVAGRGAAGEIGHIIVKDGGRRCGCGGRGHLEAYAGRASMEHEARNLVDQGHHTILFDLMEKKGKTRLSSSIWARALKRHDRMATRLLDQAAWAMSIALASVQNLLDLEAIMIGGGLGDRLGTPFIDDVRTRMHPLLHNADRPPHVIGTTLQDLSGAVGAAVLADEMSAGLAAGPRA
jgi:glucokinase